MFHESGFKEVGMVAPRHGVALPLPVQTPSAFQMVVAFPCNCHKLPSSASAGKANIQTLMTMCSRYVTVEFRRSTIVESPGLFGKATNIDAVPKWMIRLEQQRISALRVVSPSNLQTVTGFTTLLMAPK
jgi:hypothetical protein